MLDLSNKKTLLTERNKYDKSSDEVKNNLINLKEKEGITRNNILGVESDIKNLNETVNTLNIKISELSKDYNEIGRDKDKDNFNLNSKRKLLFETNNKIDILKTNIANMNKVPYSVRCIVGNPVLRGIHNILGSLIETKEEYVSMIEIALGGSINNIVVNDEGCAKEAIEYLKNHNKGRATFFPLTVIKPKSIDPDTKKEIESIIGYMGVLSDFVTYDSKYYNIVMNLKISKLIFI